MQNTKLKLTEIFYSIQGEGLFTGTPSIFVRFAGCNLGCPFCDTDFSMKYEMTPGQVISEVMNFYPCKKVVFTGGEPTIQDTKLLIELLEDLRIDGFYIAIETNGILPFTIKNVDWITCSPKTDISKLWLKEANEIKIVLGFGDFLPELYGRFSSAIKFIQPKADGLVVPKENIDWCVEYIKNNPEWRLGLQSHKMIGVR